MIRKQEEQEKKDPLYGLDIEAENEAIIKGKSKLSHHKRDLVKAMKKINDQKLVDEVTRQAFLKARNKLTELVNAYIVIEKGN